jgi:hypothetical protein
LSSHFLQVCMKCVVVFRAVESVHKTSDSDSSVFKSLTLTPS